MSKNNGEQDLTLKYKSLYSVNTQYIQITYIYKIKTY
jgi:hypothetical protein